jgi:hypothetical protein
MGRPVTPGRDRLGPLSRQLTTCPSRSNLCWTVVQPTDPPGFAPGGDRARGRRERARSVSRPSTRRPAGNRRSTRFMSIVPEHRRLEIGWTWVGLAYQRTGANREAKLLQMTHAFETLGANRVEFKTDSLNEKANPGLLGVGATFEGTFRNHMVMPGGRLRHSNYYSVIREDWPAVRRDSSQVRSSMTGSAVTSAIIDRPGGLRLHSRETT